MKCYMCELHEARAEIANLKARRDRAEDDFDYRHRLRGATIDRLMARIAELEEGIAALIDDEADEEIVGVPV